jgi:hypothetical protein
MVKGDFPILGKVSSQFTLSLDTYKLNLSNPIEPGGAENDKVAL